MNTNEKLESKVSELTNVIKGLSNRPTMTPADMNELLDALISKVEETNEESFTTLTSELSESIISILDKKYTDIKDKLSLFEDILSSQKGGDNSKTENEITRILNDIEALHSKMNSQEIQMESLSKGFEAIKNSTASGQISELCDEIVSISKSYDGITEILDKNFQEFLKRVETTSSRDEFQRLRYNLENLDGNQNILVSAMNAINEKQDEIKNIIKQSSGAQNLEKMEQLQSALNQMNRLIVETTSKADLEVLTDRLTNVVELINEFKRSFEESNESGIKSVLNGQLNNIIAQLESLKMNSASNVGEDIIRLYTSIAEFKDSVYSSINSQLTDVVNSIDVKFDKITNSVINTNLDSNENLENLTSEIQKLNSVVVDGLNTKTYEIKQEFEKLGQNNVMTIVNSIKGELSKLLDEIGSLNNSESIANLSRNIENLRNGIDIDSLIMQIDQIHSALDLTPIKEQLELLNKDEAIGLMNEKIDVILGYVRSEEVANKIEEIKESLNLEGINSSINSIEDKLDFSSLDEKIDIIKNLVENSDFSSDIALLKEKLETVSNIENQLESVKNIEEAALEIKNKLEESIRLNIQKIDEDKVFKENIQEALNVIHEMVSSISNDNGISEEISTIKDNLSLYSSKTLEAISESQAVSEKLVDSISEKLSNDLSKTKEIVEDARENLENSLSALSDKLNVIDSKIAIKDENEISDIKESIDNLFEFIRNINSNPISEQIESLKEKFASANTEGIKEVQENIAELQSNLSSSIDLIKNNLEEGLSQDFIADSINPIFDELKVKLSERLNSLEEAVASVKKDDEQAGMLIKDELENVADGLKTGLIEATEQIANSKTEMVSEIIKNSISETNGEIINIIKSSTDTISEILNTQEQKSQETLISKIEEMLELNANAASKIEFMKNVQDNIAELTAIANENKSMTTSNSDAIKSIAEKLNLNEQKTMETLKTLEDLVRENVTKEESAQRGLEIKQLIGRVNESLTSVNSALNNEVLNKENLNELIEQIRENSEDIKSEIENQFTRNADNTEAIASLTSSLEEKMSTKISILENIIDASMNKFNNKTSEILNSENEVYAKILNEKLQEAISQLKQDYETKLTDIQKIVDEKMFDTISRNNDIIRDELKYRGDVVLRDLLKAIQEKFAALVPNNEEENTETQASYTIKDIESDFAKVRLALEKTNKLTNFKEFAARLVELKNINLENAKISRIIGNDIMKFDGWLKNTTAKIELLAAKIEKSEKIKMEDLKTRLMQSDKNQAMPQKLEEVLTGIYKKYRLQETKMDDLTNKLENLSNKQSDSFDAKEFIEILYDTTKKQENIMSRMDSVEDKMDLIQAKLDHIISFIQSDD